MRKLLNISTLISNDNFYCEICQVEVECEDIYFVHLLEYHTMNDIMSGVTNEKILNMLINNNFIDIKCELCDKN